MSQEKTGQQGVSSRLSTVRYGLMSIFLAVIVLIGSSRAGAGIAEVDGTRFNHTLETHQLRLHLKGTALLRYMVFIKAYTGALYLPEDADGSEALEDIPKHLVLEYRVEISAEDFAAATSKKMSDAVNPDDFERLRPEMEALNRLYQDVIPGDRYALTYVPGIGTQLLLNGRPLGTIPGAEFARALFSVWLGDNPIDTAFRDRLLGRK